MKFLTLRSTALRLVLLALLVVATGFAAWAAQQPGDPDSGKWVPSPSNDCTDGLICVEWQYTVYGVPTSDEACCVDPAVAGTTQYQVCTSYFRHDPH